MNPSTPDDKKRPYVEELTPGTVTRTFYDKAPSQDSLNALGVKLLPNGESLEYTCGRVAAIVSDVKRVLDANGNPVQTAAGKDSVIRVSTASSYDKYGRVVANYTYDPTMPSADLTMMAVKNTYDVGGKLTSSTKYPYGAGKARSVTERYNYDRLGRVQSIEVQKDASKFAELVSYTYYPTGSVRSVVLGGSITIDYTYHISGAVASAIVKRADGSNLYKEFLSYEDCGDNGCKPQYNGNISRMTHELVTQSRIPQTRDSRYYYDFMNRLTQVDDADMMFDEAIAYDDQGRITSLRRSAHAENTTGGEYTYENRKNRLLSVAQGIGGGDFKFLGDASKDVDRDMSDPANFDYDSEGNLIEDKSKRMKISYDWRGMPIEFIQQPQPRVVLAIVCSDSRWRTMGRVEEFPRRAGLRRLAHNYGEAYKNG